MQDSLQEPSHGDAAEADRLAAAMEFASAATRWFTTALSLGLVIIIVFWAYRLGVRDASELPVIKAMNEPARSRPENTGGDVADNQGLEVNEVLGGEEASVPAESLSAPPAVALTEEDVPVVPQIDPGIALVTAPRADETGVDAEEITHENDPVAAFDPFAEVPGQVDTAVRPLPRPEQLPAEPEVAATPDPAQSRREQEQAAREQQAREQAAIEEAAQDQVDPQQAARDEETRKIQEALEAALRDEEVTRQSTVPDPNLKVQLGSFNSEIAALGFLDTLTSRHGDLLASRRISVQKVTTGALVVYRVRASGFTRADDTNALCQALRARGVDCVPVGG